MFKQLTYSTKNKLLIAGAFTLLYLIYVFALKKTVDVYTEYEGSKDKIELIANAPQRTGELEKELQEINARIGTHQLPGIKTRQLLLELVSNYCQKNKAVLREFPDSETMEKEGLLVETNRFTVEGNYNTLVKLVYLMEQEYKIGRVASVKYQLKKDFKTQKMALTATMYIQNINHKL